MYLKYIYFMLSILQIQIGSCGSVVEQKVVGSIPREHTY